MGYTPRSGKAALALPHTEGRYSSGVERSLGKGEVECSIHSSGTIFLLFDGKFGANIGLDWPERLPCKTLLLIYSGIALHVRI